jgi:hypothetical protein
MKRKHQKIHLFIWLLLLPVLVYIIYHASQGRYDIEEVYQPSATPVEGGKLQ